MTEKRIPDQGKTALVIGATGATGRHIVRLLAAHPSYKSVVAFSRRPLDFNHPKLTVRLVDFDTPEEWHELLVGDELFSAMGTTLRQAGSKEAQRKVDVDYQLNTATAARANGVGSLFLVSSPGANNRSAGFYLRMKGELDEAVEKLGFNHTVYIKPSIIDSERPDGRPGEKIGAAGVRFMAHFFPPARKYRPITAEQLASAIVNIAQLEHADGRTDFELSELFEYLA